MHSEAMLVKCALLILILATSSALGEQAIFEQTNVLKVKAEIK